MYTCQKCKKPLTEFDVNFYFGVRKNERNIENCKCHQCMTEGKVGTLIKNKTSKISLTYICAHLFCTIPLIIFISTLIICNIANIPIKTPILDFNLKDTLAPLSLIILIIFFYLTLPSIYIYTFLLTLERLPSDSMWSVCFGLLLFFGIITWIWGAIYVIKRFNWDYIEDSVIGYHYETNISSDGNIDVRQVNDWTDNGSWFKFALAGLSFPYWSLFHLFYICIIKKHIAYHIGCPKEVKAGLDYALKNTKNVYLSKSDIKYYEKQLKIYNKKVTKIKNKYIILGQQEVEERINKLSKPICYVTCTENLKNKKICKNVAIASVKEEFIFIIYIENDKLAGKIILGKRYLYFNDDTWINDFTTIINLFNNNEILFKEISDFIDFIRNNPNKFKEELVNKKI